MKPQLDVLKLFLQVKKLKTNTLIKLSVLGIISIILFMTVIPSVSADTTITPLSSGEDNWWNESWTYRKLITINHSLVDSDLTYFPVLIYISSDSDLSSKAQVNGDDISFVLYSDNTTKLNHEIELFNNVNGELLSWVNVTYLSSTIDTNIWLYYGNKNCVNQEYITGVWDSNYVMVQHLDETVGIHYDSTIFGNDGTPQCGVNQSAFGKIDGADNFDGNNDFVEVPDNDSLHLSNAITVEIWAKTNKFNAYRVISAKDKSGKSEWAFFYNTCNKLDFKFNGQSGDNINANTAITDSDWHHLVGVYNGSHIYVFIDGALDSTPLSYSDINTNNGSVNIGYTKYWNCCRFKGILDEVRISKIARESSWFKTSYNNQNDPDSFISIGSEEQCQYNLIINIEGQGIVTKVPENSTYIFGTVVNITAFPDIGYYFDYWSGDLSGSVNPETIVINENKNITAHFSQHQYAININIEGNGAVNVDNSDPYHYGDIVNLTAIASKGSKFDHWSGNLSGKNNPAIIVMTENKNVTAHFVKSSDNGGNGGNGGSTGGGEEETSSPVSSNKRPGADLSAGEPYLGIVNKEIEFNGTLSYDSDGYITEWFWNFGDGTSALGEITTHNYSIPGNYTVVLIVKDNKGATDSDPTTVVIIEPNYPPSEPKINGPDEGFVNIEYLFTIFSTDEDNDEIKYTIDWEDGSISESDYLPAGEFFNVSHKWTESRNFTVKLTADDNKTISTDELTIAIKVQEKPNVPEESNIALIVILIIAFIILLTSLILAKRRKK